MKPIIALFLAGLMACSSASAEIVPIPQGAPLELENYQPDLPANGTTGAVMLISATVIACCIVFYVYKEEADPYDAHVFSLMRDTYNDDWQAVAWIEVAVTPKKAKALFADHIESGSGYRYRVIDWGSVNQ